jgi:hypothetical protein
VRTATELQSALTTAQANGQDDIVKIVQGTYLGNFSYESYESTEGRHISILGGYTTGCADRVRNPSNTILDGNNAGIVLLIENFLNGGNIFIEGITAQHGNCLDVFHAGGINAVSAVSESYSLARGGDITVEECVITKNTGIWYGGVLAKFVTNSGAQGDIALVRNTIVDNVAERSSSGAYAFSQWGNVNCINNIIARNIVLDGGIAGLYAYAQLPGHCILTNNTIVFNVASSDVGGIELTRLDVKVYNNIVWGNTPNDIHLAFTFYGTAEGYNNNYSLMDGDGEEWTLSAGNIDADPFFMGARDFHLNKGSPCIDKGANMADALPAVDLDGNSRKRDGDGDRIAVVDMGSYEYIMPVTLKDLILALQIVAEMNPSDAILIEDVDADGKIGLEEAINALQVVSGQRAQP